MSLLYHQESPSATGLKAKVIRPPPADSAPRPSARPPPSTAPLPVEKQKVKEEELVEEEGKKDGHNRATLCPFSSFLKRLTCNDIVFLRK